MFLLTYLVLLNSSQEEFDDEDDWNPCKAAGVCLMLLAQCCENDILTSKNVIDFITANIEKEDWKSRDAAVMAFGKQLSRVEKLNIKEQIPQGSNA